MERGSVNGEQIKLFFEGGLMAIEEHKQEIDRLNVFPVPDGDTGKNMYLTIFAAVNELSKLDSLYLSKVCEALTKGSLMGARGNSGVILSQLIRGFAEAIKEKEKISVPEFAKAWQNAVTTAYRAVIKPVEGTMLTVAKGIAQGISEAVASDNDLLNILALGIRKGQDVLQKTPEMLPALKKAGVVDAGGKGLLVLFEGGLTNLSNGVKVNSNKELNVNGSNVKQFSHTLNNEEEDFLYTYCCEFLLKRAVINNKGYFKKSLQKLGDSMIIVDNGDLIKIHIHTNHPGEVLESCLQYGTLHNINISNMRDQWEQKQEESRLSSKQTSDLSDCKEIGIIAVAAGQGIIELFNNLGVDQIIEGGQTMNPPVEDFVKAINKVKAKSIIILPNNKNLIMAAEQAKNFTNRRIEIVPSTDMPAGIAALLAFSSSLNLQENKERMCQVLKQIKSAMVTYAVRDAEIKDKLIKEGDIIGLFNDELIVAGSSLEEVMLELISKITSPEDELITIYSGKDVTQEDTEKIAMKIRCLFPDIEIETHFGGQPIYYYLISIE